MEYDDILFSILSQMKQKDRLKCGVVCKRWYRMIQDNFRICIMTSKQLFAVCKTNRFDLNKVDIANNISLHMGLCGASEGGHMNLVEAIIAREKPTQFALDCALWK